METPMNSPDPMTREELLELAALDAAGLLDQYEAALYTRSFHHAPIAVQEEIRELQAEITSDVSILPELEPPAALREHVLARVIEAIDRESASQRPLATIGRPRQRSRAVAGRIGFGEAATFWRAASFALIATVVILGYFLAEASRHNQEMAMAVVRNLTHDALQQIGPPVEEYLYSPTAEWKPMRATRPTNARGVVFVEPGLGTAFLITDGLPATSTDPDYTLVMIDEKEERHTLGTFGSTEGISTLSLTEIPLELLANVRFEIIDAVGAVILAT
jgi:hypothetical protein